MALTFSDELLGGSKEACIGSVGAQQELLSELTNACLLGLVEKIISIICPASKIFG